MGYENTALVAVDKSYGELDWGEWSDEAEIAFSDDYKTVYRFDWSKRTASAVKYFFDELVQKDDEEDWSYYLNETFGVIEMGEDADDIEYWGDYWEFDIEVERGLNIY